MEQIIEFFDNAKMFYLATTEGDQPGVANMYKDKQDIFEVFALEKIIAIKTSFKGEEVVYEG